MPKRSSYVRLEAVRQGSIQNTEELTYADLQAIIIALMNADLTDKRYGGRLETILEKLERIKEAK